MSSPFIEAPASVSSSSSAQSPYQRLVDRALRELPVVDPASQASPDPVSHDQLVEPVQRINAAMRPYGVEFELTEERAMPVVRLVDRESGEVIRQIPVEELIAVSGRLDELRGRLVNLEA
jgi:flagellar protein FlaG